MTTTTSYVPTTDTVLLADEYRALLALYGEVQQRCSHTIRAQAAEIAALRAQLQQLGVEQYTPADDLHALEASLAAADLVICQTGCLSHGDYWRLKDHCKRTGKTCVLVPQPQALRIVRIHGETLD
jgi:hypothetical protein